MVARRSNPDRLEDVGWGVIFAQDTDPSVHSALEPLIRLRREQTRGESRFRIFEGEQGFRRGETKASYLARLGVPTGPAEKEALPYYLLIVGSPEQIPLTVQQHLDVTFAVGRLHFDDGESGPPRLESYARYVERVMAGEHGELPQERRVALFSPARAGDAHGA